MNIKEFISAVRNRPRMYVKEERLDYVYYLIIGYLGSNLSNDNIDKEDSKFHSFFPEWLLAWTKVYVDKGYERKNFFWYCIIKDVASSENEAFELFFKLCDEFFQQDEEAIQKFIDAADELEDE